MYLHTCLLFYAKNTITILCAYCIRVYIMRYFYIVFNLIWAFIEDLYSVLLNDVKKIYSFYIKTVYVTYKYLWMCFISNKFEAFTIVHFKIICYFPGLSKNILNLYKIWKMVHFCCWFCICITKRLIDNIIVSVGNCCVWFWMFSENISLSETFRFSIFRLH